MLRVENTEIFVRVVRTRMPFRYGIATMSAVPHLMLRVTMEIDGQKAVGMAADHLPPKWFTKNPESPYHEDVQEMLEVIQHACTSAQDMGDTASLFDLWQALYHRQKVWAVARGLPPLLWNFGVTLVERAALEAFCRARQTTFSNSLREGLLGIRLGEIYPELDGMQPTEFLPSEPLREVRVRHTVGLSDPLTAADVPEVERVSDGLPQSLDECLRVDGVEYLKIKLSGDIQRDRERLRTIAALLQNEGRTCAFTLDGNENYHAAEPFRELWAGLLEDREISRLLQRLIFVEQPFHRDVALTEETGRALIAWRERPPIIIDESEGELGTAAVALERGYLGTSHKNCKGIFKGVANTCLIAHRRRQNPNLPLQISAEDLSNIGPIALPQDLAVVAALGIPHAERNGHHYFAALQQFPAGIQKEALEAHPDLYRMHRGVPVVRVDQGGISTASVNQAPLGVGFVPDTGELTSLKDWNIAEL